MGHDVMMRCSMTYRMMNMPRGLGESMSDSMHRASMTYDPKPIIPKYTIDQPHLELEKHKNYTTLGPVYPTLLDNPEIVFHPKKYWFDDPGLFKKTPDPEPCPNPYPYIPSCLKKLYPDPDPEYYPFQRKKSKPWEL
jgi:hypothetical protein